MPYRRWNAILPLVAIVVPIAAFEGVMRLMVKPSQRSYGTFRGMELPPLKLIPRSEPVRRNTEAPADRQLVPGKTITRGDLYGYVREDREIGYTWEPNRRSANGWWQSNERGARASEPTPKAVPAGKRRVVVFGDSFTAGTRVPQEETWASQLQGLRGDLDVVNFGVDGYGLGQSLLLNRRVGKEIDYDVALFVFVPWHNPWRDVNVIRHLGEGWDSFTPMPRFDLDDAGVHLVPAYYPSGTLVYVNDHPNPSKGLRDHLVAHDRFYVRSLYDPPPILSDFILWKLIAARTGEDKRIAIRREIGSNIDGEAFEVSRRILKAAGHEARARGRRAVVAVLPVEADLRQLARDPEARDRWNRIVEGVRDQGVPTIDLSEALAAAPPEEIDSGYDGTHYGPRASKVIAAALARHADF